MIEKKAERKKDKSRNIPFKKYQNNTDFIKKDIPKETLQIFRSRKAYVIPIYCNSYLLECNLMRTQLTLERSLKCYVKFEASETDLLVESVIKEIS